MSTQTKFSDGQYKEFHSPDICAVCHAPAEPIKFTSYDAYRRPVENTSWTYTVGHADSSPLPKTGKYARRLTKGTGKAGASKVYKMVALGNAGSIPGGDIEVKLCARHAAMLTEPRTEPTYYDPRTAAGYRWWFEAGQLPLWGRPYHEIKAEEEAREAAALAEFLAEKRAAFHATIDMLVNQSLPLALPEHTDGPFITPCGRCGAPCDCDPRLPCGQIRCEDCNRQINKRYSTMRNPKFARNGFQDGAWYAQIIIKSGPAIDMPAVTSGPVTRIAQTEDSHMTTDSVASPEVKLNKSNVWLFYPTMPDAETRAALKECGMQYAKSKRGWWIPAWKPENDGPADDGLERPELNKRAKAAIAREANKPRVYSDVESIVITAKEIRAENAPAAELSNRVKGMQAKAAKFQQERADNIASGTDPLKLAHDKLVENHPEIAKVQSVASRAGEMTEEISVLFNKYQSRPAGARRAVAVLVHDIPKGPHAMSTAKRKLYDVTILKTARGYALKFYHAGRWERDPISGHNTLADGLRHVLKYLGAEWSVLGYDADMQPVARKPRNIETETPASQAGEVAPTASQEPTNYGATVLCEETDHEGHECQRQAWSKCVECGRTLCEIHEHKHDKRTVCQDCAEFLTRNDKPEPTASQETPISGKPSGMVKASQDKPEPYRVIEFAFDSMFGWARNQMAEFPTLDEAKSDIQRRIDAMRNRTIEGMVKYTVERYDRTAWKSETVRIEAPKDDEPEPGPTASQEPENHDFDTMAGGKFTDDAMYIMFPAKPRAELIAELEREGAHHSMIKIDGSAWAWILPLRPDPDPVCAECGKVLRPTPINPDPVCKTEDGRPCCKRCAMRWINARMAGRTTAAIVTDVTPSGYGPTEDSEPAYVIEASAPIMVVGPGTPTAHTYPKPAQPEPAREVRYITAADTAKLVRETLKTAYGKSVKFSVTSSTYSMGASVSVRWTDGPTTKAVDALVGQFKGSSFDGMIDLKTSHDSLLDGELVHYAADHVSTEREYSTATVQRAIDSVWSYWGVEADKPDPAHYSTCYHMVSDRPVYELINRALSEIDLVTDETQAATVAACQPKPAERVTPIAPPAATSTKKMVSTLTENDQDFEWYPTTQAMIEVVARGISVDTQSILDIGAGDGRVLLGLSVKCPHAKLYGIELSQLLVQAQPASVIPIGTNLFEQNLACLPVDHIFCNPPYSEYEEWTCKIISEGYAQKSFLVIPQRWKESKLITEALKKRGATARVINSDNFHNAERQARAVVDVVEVTYPRKENRYNEVKDPFDIWFDANIDTFDHAEEFKESETGSDLKRRYANSSIDDMVTAYREEYTLLENNYRAIFKLDYAILKELGIDKNHVRDGLKKKMAGLKIKYWQILFNRLDAITSRLSTKSRKSLLDKLTENTSVEFTAPNAYAVVLWAIKNARQYFDEQLIDLFKALSTFENALKYKSNIKTWAKDGWRYIHSTHPEDAHRKPTHFALDYRIVVAKTNAIQGGGYDYSHYYYTGNLKDTCHDLLADVVAVLSNLGFMTSSRPSVAREWVGGKWQDWYKGDEILFQVKAYMNGNLHFRFTPAAIRALNIEAGRLLKWVRSADEVVTEMGYTQEEAEQYFNSNAYMLSNSVKLLGEIAGGAKVARPQVSACDPAPREHKQPIRDDQPAPDLVTVIKAEPVDAGHHREKDGGTSPNHPTLLEFFEPKPDTKGQ